MKNLEVGSLLLNSVFHHRSFRTPVERQSVDGSKISMALVDDLATLPGPLKDKLLVLYACGVHDFQKEVFDPRQVLAMIRFNNVYRPDGIITRMNGNGDGSFCYVGPDDKDNLLTALCEGVENFDPADQKGLDLNGAREDLEKKGVDGKVLASTSNRDLAVYFMASEAQFLLALDHPFWERNGRSSEEFMHLACAINGTTKVVFYQDADQRYNPVTQERMSLLDESAISLLPVIAAKMGLETEDRNFGHVDDLYKAWFEGQGRPGEFEKRDRQRKGLIRRFLQSRTALAGEPALMDGYFAALKSIVSERIGRLGKGQFDLLSQDNITSTLTAHHLSRGRLLEF